MGDEVYRERLVPGWWAFAFALGFVALIAVAYGAVLGTAFGIGLFVIAGGIVIAVLIATSPVIVADRTGIRAGAARLPRACIGAVDVLDPEALAALRTGGPRASSTAFTVLRPSRSRVAVRFAVVDPEDPHPAWIVTSRRPTALAAALQ